MKELIELHRGGIGTHSIRKFASTWAAELGCTDSEIEVRGRWKGGKGGRTVNRYISVKQLLTDGKASDKICIGGAVKYRAKPDSLVTCDFLLNIVCPNISRFFSNLDHTNKVAKVLALPVLFAAYDPMIDYIMTNEVRDRIRRGYNDLRGNDLPGDYNPVEKVPLIVHRYENMLAIDETIEINDESQNDVVGGGVAARHHQNFPQFQQVPYFLLFLLFDCCVYCCSFSVFCMFDASMMNLPLGKT